LLDHLLKVVDALCTYVHGVLKRLEVLEEAALDFADSGAESTDEGFEGFESVIDISAVAWEVLLDHVHRGQGVVDK
jgi:hypothetical protein